MAKNSTSDVPGYEVPAAVAAGMISTLLLAKHLTFDGVLAIVAGTALVASSALLAIYGRTARYARVMLIYFVSLAFFVLLTWLKVHFL
jgi:hypothetical protein